jgi:hypothetical protein
MLFLRKNTKQKIMRKEIFMDPTLCFIVHFVYLGSNERPYLWKVFPNRIKTIEHTSLKFYLTNNRVWWCLVPTNYRNK